MKVIVAGTFTILHDGHKALLDVVLDLNMPIIVGLTADAFIKKSKPYGAKIWEKDLEPLKKHGISKIYMVSSRQPETVKSMLNDVAASLLMRTMERK